MVLVAGVDTSTQSCKVLIHDAESGELLRAGVARHKAGTEIAPHLWLRAFEEAVKAAGGLDGVKALSIAGQQHGMVALDADGAVIRNAILWNDTRSAPQAEKLVSALPRESGETSVQAWARRVGSTPVASLTVTKVAWLAEHEPDNFNKTAAICLSHDWLGWQLTGDSRSIGSLWTDRSDASGTGYFDSITNTYDRAILELATGDTDWANKVTLPRIVAPNAVGAEGHFGGNEFLIGAGAGDNAGAAFGLCAKEGEVILSVGTSGVVSMVVPMPVQDPSGVVTGFASADNAYLPLVCTLNASKPIDAFTQSLGVDHERFAELALSAAPGAEGLCLVPYFDGERTPNKPFATGSLLGMTTTNFTPANIARAVIEGVLCGLKDALDALVHIGAKPTQITLIGGGARSKAFASIAPTILGLPVTVPEASEWVAEGAARQAAWMLSGQASPPEWRAKLRKSYQADEIAFIHERYVDGRALFLERRDK